MLLRFKSLFDRVGAIRGFSGRSGGSAVARLFGILAVFAAARSALGEAVVLIEAGDTWKYFKGTEAPPSDWAQPEFDDSGWLEGPTGIGYGDGDDATVLDDMQNGYIAFFARRAFTVADVASITRLLLAVDYDDGFVAYLNGTEVARGNIGTAGEPVAFDAPATAAREAGAPETFEISISLLRSGVNVLAIQLHNVNLPSSDASLIPRLVANEPLPPSGLSCARSGTTVNLAWTNGSTTYESIQIERNGTVIAQVAGDATTYADTSFDGLDTQYRVIGVEGGKTYASGTCSVGCTQVTLTCTLALVEGKTQATVQWTGTPAGTSSIEVRREGTLMTTLDPAATQYLDPDVESSEPEDDTGYTITFLLANGRTCAVNCAASLCPTNLTAKIVPGRIELSWENVVKAWERYEISRNGEVVDAAVPGDATSWVDATLVPEIGEGYDYVLHPVGPLSGDGTQCDLSVQTTYAPEIARYEPPPGGWDYILDFETLGSVQYNPTAGEKGNLDGGWIRSTDRDLWDGSAPFEVGEAPDGLAPGGVDLVDRPGLGPCGADARVLRVLDPGDASQPIGTAFPQGYTAPNNSRIALGYDLGSPTENLLKSGITFATRIRLSPDAPAYMSPNPNSGDGDGIHNGTGHVGVYYRDPAGTAHASAAFALNSGNNGGDIQLSTDGVIDLDGVGLLRFVSLWMTVVENATTPGTYDVNVYVNGSLEPSAEVSGTALTLQGSSVQFGANVANYIGIGSNNTGGDAMFEVDYVAFKRGVFAPSASPCGGGAQFRRADATDDGNVNITDAIFVLNFLFLGGESPACPDAADVNDDGGINITDGILILNYLFLGGEAPPSPGPETCGPDPVEDQLDPCFSTQC